MYDSLGYNVPLQILFKTFDVQILPILEYGCEIFYTGKTINKFETLHLKYIKRALGVKQQTSSYAVYGETGRFPLELRQKELMLRYWSRLITLNKDNILFKIYCHLLQLHSLGHKTWCASVLSVLDSVNLKDIWNNHIDTIHLSCSNLVKSMNCAIRSALHDQFRDRWEIEINDTVRNPLLRTYKIFKSSHEIEKYLLYVRNYKYRRSISQFRVSSHSLEIEKGRHTKPKTPENLRKCKYCNSGQIDDEMHFFTKMQLSQRKSLKTFQ